MLVHPYDDAAVIAGQGTIACEMLEDCPDIEIIAVPMGGGGLIGGIALAAKALKPSIRIVGAEAALYPSFHNALHGAACPSAARRWRRASRSRMSGVSPCRS